MVVSVLTPVLNEAAYLREVVARMQAQDIEGDAEFLFIDGGSTDDSRAILAGLAAQDPRIVVLDNPQRRTPFALNIGLRAARGEFVARMDAHTRYPPSYLRLGAERLRAGGVTHVSGPQLAVGDGRGFSDRVALALSTPLGAGGASFRSASDAEFEVDTGFTGMWRRDVLVRAGGWDEEWLTDQDCELAFRLHASEPGAHVCVPAMAAEYIPRDSPARARAAVLAVRAAQGQDLPAPPCRDAPVAPAAARRGRDGGARPGQPARAHRDRGLRRSRSAPRRLGPPVPGQGRARRRRCRWSSPRCTSPTASACSPGSAATAFRCERWLPR